MAAAAELTGLNSYHVPLLCSERSLLVTLVSSLCCLPQCAALVGEDQPLCPDLPELDLSELDVNDLDTDSFLGGLKWCSDQSEIISNQYNNEPANIFEVSVSSGECNFSLTLACAELMWCQAWTCMYSYMVDSRKFIITARGFLCYGKTMFGKWCFVELRC